MSPVTDPLPSPEDVLDYWFGETRQSADAAEAQHKLWFQKSFTTDKDIAERFLPLLIALVNGRYKDWAAQSPSARLAAIIVLDQFSRNIFRDHRLAFAHDALALHLAEQGIAAGDDMQLTEVERIFFYLPFEHAESTERQTQCVDHYTKLLAEARLDYKSLVENTLDYAHKHREVIARFGRFPHRNAILKRPSTPEEQAYLNEPGSGF